MKKIITLIFLAFFFESCEKEKSIMESNEVQINIDYSFELHCVEEYNEWFSPTAYLGDTIRYKINLKSDVLIEAVAVYYMTDRRGKDNLPFDKIGHDIHVNSLQINAFEDSFYYIYPLDENRFFNIYHEHSQETFFIFDYYDSTGIVKTDTLPSFYLKELNTLNHQRLYNIALQEKGYARGFKLVGSSLLGYDMQNSINCNGVCLQTTDTSLFMVNIPNDDYIAQNDSAITKEFIHGWQTQGNSCVFSKVENEIKYDQYSPPTSVEFKDLNKPWQILNIYSNNSPRITKIKEPKVGDLYVFKKIDQCNEIVGIIDITHIEDDGLTSDSGGNEFDYIEFRIKSFSTSGRFK